MDYLSYGSVVSITIPLLYNPTYNFMVISAGHNFTDIITPKIAHFAAHYYIEAVRCTCFELTQHS